MLDRLKAAIEQSIFYLSLISKLEIPLEIALTQIESSPDGLADRLRWLMTEAECSFECYLTELKFKLSQIVLEIESLEKEQGHE